MTTIIFPAMFYIVTAHACVVAHIPAAGTCEQFEISDGKRFKLCNGRRVGV